jgi:hypothetical protein
MTHSSPIGTESLQNFKYEALYGTYKLRQNCKIETVLSIAITLSENLQ